MDEREIVPQVLFAYQYSHTLAPVWNGRLIIKELVMSSKSQRLTGIAWEIFAR